MRGRGDRKKQCAEEDQGEQGEGGSARHRVICGGQSEARSEVYHQRRLVRRQCGQHAVLHRLVTRRYTMKALQVEGGRSRKGVGRLR